MKIKSDKIFADKSLRKLLFYLVQLPGIVGHVSIFLYLAENQKYSDKEINNRKKN